MDVATRFREPGTLREPLPIGRLVRSASAAGCAWVLYLVFT